MSSSVRASLLLLAIVLGGISSGRSWILLRRPTPNPAKGLYNPCEQEWGNWAIICQRDSDCCSGKCTEKCRCLVIEFPELKEEGPAKPAVAASDGGNENARTAGPGPRAPKSAAALTSLQEWLCLLIGLHDKPPA